MTSQEESALEEIKNLINKDGFYRFEKLRIINNEVFVFYNKMSKKAKLALDGLFRLCDKFCSLNKV